MASGVVYIRVELTNRRALRALQLVCEALEDAAESAPWNEDLPRAVKAMRYAMKHLQPVVIETGEDDNTED